MIDKISEFMEMAWQSCLSLLKIMLLSRFETHLPKGFDKKNELLILANGPSLSATIIKSPDFLKQKTLMAVNFAVTSPLFEQLRPGLYLIADPLFWIVPEKRELLFRTMAQKTDWEMILFIPIKACRDKEWQWLIEENKNIKIYPYNTTPVEGFSVFTHWAFREGWGMPRPHNVLIPAIAIGLRMPFKTIYVAGADHSWLPEITVTDNNEVLMHQKHFYDRETSRPETVMKENLKPQSLHTILRHMSIAFKAYFILQDYAVSLKKEIINITPGSYIDAFKRMKL